MINPPKKFKRPDVLVCVLKTSGDRELLLKEKWYRVPLKHAPRRKPKYLAFYQPLKFGERGEKIELYGRVKYWMLKKRKELIPEEKDHPRAEDTYLQFMLGRIIKLRKPVLNRRGIRVSFGFTTLDKLRHSPDIRRLFDIPPIEGVFENMLGKNEIAFYRELRVRRENGKIFRLDFALPCRRGLIDVECDGFRWHSHKIQRLKDRRRDRELKKLGWKVMRITEEELVRKPAVALRRVKKLLRKFGGSHPELQLKIRV